jgi:predicted Fe-S protein YdhL (DUF1289 family)
MRFSGVNYGQIRAPHPAALPMSEIYPSVQSPCVRNCCLDDDLTCLGCFRTLEEIKEWGTAGNQRRLTILQDARRRQARRIGRSAE